MADLEGLKNEVIKGDQDKAKQITEAALADEIVDENGTRSEQNLT